MTFVTSSTDTGTPSHAPRNFGSFRFSRTYSRPRPLARSRYFRSKRSWCLFWRRIASQTRPLVTAPPAPRSPTASRSITWLPARGPELAAGFDVADADLLAGGVALEEGAADANVLEGGLAE